MSFTAGLTTSKMLAAFEEGIIAQGGEVADKFDDGKLLIVRSVLPRIEDVRRGDAMRAGVAMKATGEEVCVYPYTFRLVCKNGAIVAQTMESLRLTDIHILEPESALESIREAVGACCSNDRFSDTVRKMGQSCAVDMNQVIAQMAFISSHSLHRYLPQIMQTFFKDGDHSRFGLANAITAVARDVKDPSQRWDLEEQGGAIAIGSVPTIPPNQRRTVVARARRMVEVET